MKALFLSLLPSLLAVAVLSHFASGVHSIDSPRLPVDYHKRQCDCYVVSGPEPGYFENYAFWDFRKIPLSPRDRDVDGNQKRRSDDYSDSETVPDDTAEPNIVLLSDTGFAIDWTPQNWHRNGNRMGPVPIINSPENIFFARNSFHPEDPGSTHLVLRTTRFPNHTATAEIEHYLRNIFHCSLRVRMRIMSIDAVVQQPTLYGRPLPNNATTYRSEIPRGACAGIFTYRSSTCESDIEILTSDPPNIVRYANQPDYDPVTDTAIPEAVSIGMLSEPWTSSTTHRVDWLQDISRWYADGQLQASKTYRVPNLPSIMAINLWSNGGNWTGDIPVGQSVYVGIEWIEFAYNTSLKFHNAPDDIVPVQRHMNGPVIQLDAMDVEQDELRPMEETYLRRRGRQCRRPCYLDDVDQP